MSKDIREFVYQIVRRAEVPIDPEKIARKANVGWGTALRYALELVIFGQIQGLKTSKSWVFWLGPPNLLNRGRVKRIERSRC